MVDYREIVLPSRCPFCGGKAEVHDLGNMGYFVKCPKCEVNQDKLYKQRCDAVRAWNKRENESNSIGMIQVSEEEYDKMSRAMLITMYLKDLLRMIEEMEDG